MARVWLLHTRVHVASLGAGARPAGGQQQHLASVGVHGEAMDDFSLYQRLLGFSEQA